MTGDTDIFFGVLFYATQNDRTIDIVSLKRLSFNAK